jgi:hypothetical protein
MKYKYSMDFLNDCVKVGRIIIDKQSFFTQDFHTKDNKLSVESFRRGGGFTVGQTFYDLSIVGNDGKEILQSFTSLEPIYEIVEKYLNKGGE